MEVLEHPTYLVSADSFVLACGRTVKHPLPGTGRLQTSRLTLCERQRCPAPAVCLCSILTIYEIRNGYERRREETTQTMCGKDVRTTKCKTYELIVISTQHVSPSRHNSEVQLLGKLRSRCTKTSYKGPLTYSAFLDITNFCSLKQRQAPMTLFCNWQLGHV